jgi:transposase
MPPPRKEGAIPAKRYPITLSDIERQHLRNFVKHGKKSAQASTRARILLLADEQRADDEITRLLGVNRTTVHRVRKSYRERGLNHTLADQPRSGTPAKIDGRMETTLTMLACSDPPEGYGRWTLQLLADKLVELGVIESISLESVRTTLKKTNSNLG